MRARKHLSKNQFNHNLQTSNHLTLPSRTEMINLENQFKLDTSKVLDI